MNNESIKVFSVITHLSLSEIEAHYLYITEFFEHVFCWSVAVPLGTIRVCFSRGMTENSDVLGASELVMIVTENGLLCNPGAVTAASIVSNLNAQLQHESSPLYRCFEFYPEAAKWSMGQQYLNRIVGMKVLSFSTPSCPHSLRVNIELQQLSWEEPLHPFGNILGYAVSIRSLSDKYLQFEHLATVSADTRMVSVIPGNEYMIQAVNSYGRGCESKIRIPVPRPSVDSEVSHTSREILFKQLIPMNNLDMRESLFRGLLTRKPLSYRDVITLPPPSSMEAKRKHRLREDTVNTYNLIQHVIHNNLQQKAGS